MGTIYTNKSAAKHCVGWYEHHKETPLDVLEDFVNWTHKKHLKNYIEIGNMLGVESNKAKHLMYKAALPGDEVICRMKELMAD